MQLLDMIFRLVPPCRDGATIPALAEFQSVLNLQTTPFGWGLADNIHAPNERLKVNLEGSVAEEGCS